MRYFFQFTSCLLASFLLPLQFSSAQQCNLSTPAHLKVSGISACSATLHWSPQTSAVLYKVSFKKAGITGWSAQISVHDTLYTFTNLDHGTQYNFRVRSFCTDGSKSAYSMKKATLPSCEVPFNINTVTDSVVTISFSTNCSFDSAYCRYGLAPGALTTTVASTQSGFHISGLQSNTTYYFQVSACPLAQNNWTVINSFQTIVTSPPNIVLILLDDARFDFYSCNGAPSFVQTPNIDRIANEGVNFKNNFVVNSLCAPSRATIATGMYTNHHGVFDNLNQASLNPNLPLLPGILKDDGYYTALVGKNHKIFNFYDNDFNYWLESTVTTDSETKFDYSGVTKTIKGYDTNILTDSAVAVMSRAHGPFLVWLAYTATHKPLDPESKYRGLYDSLPMPLGPDTARYTVNYPSCIYNVGSAYQVTPQQADSLFFLTYEEMASVNDGVGKILHALDSTGKLNNTMIIFTSDNGHMLGEHHLDLKRVAYEQSLRVPLFIRYPAWFPDSSIVKNQFSLNVDLAPTILDAAGISGNYNMDGISLRKLFNGDASRTSMYYHYWYSEEWPSLPGIFAVRDSQYKYVTYQCNSNTEEFFDLKNDPLEMTNLINTSSYSSLINQYKMKLTTMQDQVGDTLYDPGEIGCHVVNPINSREDKSEPLQELTVFPNPADDEFFISNTSNQVIQLHMFNCFGEEILYRQLTSVENQIDVNQLSTGIYYLSIQDNGLQYNSKVLVIH